MVVTQTDGDLSFEQNPVGNALRGVLRIRNATEGVPYRVKDKDPIFESLSYKHDRR
jgi:hypothetical protein